MAPACGANKADSAAMPASLVRGCGVRRGVAIPDLYWDQFFNV